MLDRTDRPIGQFTADDACDEKPNYDIVINHSADAAIVILPRANTIEPIDNRPLGQRDQYIAATAEAAE